MGAIKQYLLKMQELTDSQFGQNAIEWAIFAGLVTLTYDVQTDQLAIMNRYDLICDEYRAHLREKAA